MKYREWLAWARSFLQDKGCPDAEVDAWYLLEYAAGLSKAAYYLHMEDEADEAAMGGFRALVERRGSRVPLQYLTGTQEFMGLPFFVNEHVLIPRQDTELLAEEALKEVRKLPEQKKPHLVLDLCTGSGCILLSLLALSDGIEGVGADISEAALETAKKNAAALKLERRCRWVESDLFEKVRGTYSLIVSNPPYIASGELEELMPEVRDHEPRIALDGHEDGLYFYRKIIKSAPEYLAPGGSLFLEIGWDQRKAVQEMMEAAGFADVRVFRDYQGNDRMVTGRRKGLEEKRNCDIMERSI